MKTTSTPRDLLRARLRASSACYSDARISELIPPDGMPLADVLRLDIPAQDRLVVAMWPGAIAKPVRCRWLGRLVRRALGCVPDPDPRSLAVLEALEVMESGGQPLNSVGDDAAMAATQATYPAARAKTHGARAAAEAARWAAETASWAAEAYSWAADTGAKAADHAARSAYSSARPKASAARAKAHGARAANAEREQQIKDLLELLGS